MLEGGTDVQRQVTHSSRVHDLHILVGLAVGAIVSTKAGIIGFIVGGLLAAWAHALLDAPLARFIANVA